jgi:UDP-N-acetylmuramate dehydrogenase
MIVQENIALAPLTTLRIGGPARYFVEAKASAEVNEAIAFAHAKNLPFFVFGGGSNLVVADSGWPGLVLKIAITGIDRRHGDGTGGKALFDVGAGESWDRFVSHAVVAQCAGVECLSGIPGCVGGTPIQNVGAYGQEVAETIESVEVFDVRDGQIRELCNEACGFAYRSSIFNTSERGRFIILRVT